MQGDVLDLQSPEVSVVVIDRSNLNKGHGLRQCKIEVSNLVPILETFADGRVPREITRILAGNNQMQEIQWTDNGYPNAFSHITGAESNPDSMGSTVDHFLAAKAKLAIGDLLSVNPEPGQVEVNIVSGDGNTNSGEPSIMGVAMFTVFTNCWLKVYMWRHSHSRHYVELAIRFPKRVQIIWLDDLDVELKPYKEDQRVVYDTNQLGTVKSHSNSSYTIRLDSSSQNVGGIDSERISRFDV